jgi:hypothetical protein
MAEERLSRMEGLLQEAATRMAAQQQIIDQLSAAAASQQQQHPASNGAGSTGQKLVDTRVLGKPSTFSGETDANGKPTEGMAWTPWRFTLRAYLTAVNPRVRHLMDESEKATENPNPIENSDMGNPEDRELSEHLFYTLAMLCRGKALQVVQRADEGAGCECWKQLAREYEPRTPARFQGMLTELLDPSLTDDGIQSIYEWERAVRRYEEQSGDVFPESIKVAILGTKLSDSRLRAHMNLNATRLSTYGLARKEAVDYLRAKRTWNEKDSAMEVDAITEGKGKKGKGKGKSKKGGKGGGGDCFYCGKPNHRKAECRMYLADKKNDAVKPDAAGKYAGSAVQKDGTRKGGKGAGKAEDLGAITMWEDQYEDDGDGFIFSIEERSRDNDIMAMELLFDTCAARSTCPREFAPHRAVQPSHGVALMTADGSRMEHYGQKIVRMKSTDTGTMLKGTFEVTNTKKPIMAASALVDTGHGAWLHGDGSYLIDAQMAEEIGHIVRAKAAGHAIPLHKKRGIYVLPVETDGIFALEDGEVEVEVEDVDEEKFIEESKVAMTKLLPKEPSDEERRSHELTHLPYRSWCYSCVAGTSKEDPHKRQAKVYTIAEVGADYCFIGRTEDQELATILVLTIMPLGASGAIQVVRKGADEYTVSSFLHYLDLWGVSEVVLKSDQEPSIAAVLAEVKRRRQQPTAVEHSPVGSHQSNGRIESEVSRIESMVRTLVAGLESKLGGHITSQSLVLPWVARHAAFLRTRLVVREDGRTSWQRIRGKPYSSALAEIGECVLFRNVSKDLGKLDSRWETGVFLGRRDVSDEIIVGTINGVHFARSFKRKCEKDRWSRQDFDAFIGVPWNPRGVAMSAPVASGRRKYITRTLVVEHGATDGCHGCSGDSSVHNPRCRARFEKIFKDEDHRAEQMEPIIVQVPVAQDGQLQEQHRPLLLGDDVDMEQEFVPAADLDMAPQTPPLQPADGAMEVNAVCEEPEQHLDWESLLGQMKVAYDHYTGETLDKQQVMDGIRKELSEMDEFEVFTWVDESEVPRGSEIITTKMFHRQKDENTVRSRIVGRQYKTDRNFEFYAGTPPLAMLKLIVSRAASRGTSRQVGGMDISVAFFHAFLKEPLHAYPPPELRRPGKLWLVRKALYGTRPASRAFQDLVNGVFDTNKFHIMQTVACLAYSPTLDVLIGFHGDDFVYEGEPTSLDKVEEMISSTFKSKIMPRVGPGAEREAALLRRSLLWNEQGFFLEPDIKHFENLQKLLDSQSVKPAPTPISKQTGRGMRNALDLLGAEEAATYRRGTGILMYVAPDRFDLQYACKVLAQDMSAPHVISMARLRRVSRYCAGLPDVGTWFQYQAEPTGVTVWVDGDWSGDAVTCKSTSAGAVQHGGHTLETWSVTQQAISLSSGESEFYALGSGCARGLTIKHVLQEVVDAQSSSAIVDMNINTDSDAARGMLHRQGCGRVRHLQTRYLWHQKALKDGDFTVHYVKTSDNPVDCGTKAVDEDIITRCMARLNLVTRAVAGFAKKPLAVALVFLGGVNGEVLEFTDQKGCLTEIVITAVVVSLCWIVFILKTRLSDSGEERRLRERIRDLELRPQGMTPAPAGQQAKTYMDVGVQGLVSYTRWRATPRYQPLAEHEWGAWPESRKQR